MVARKPRRCIDCIAEGITSKRKAPHPGPRCTSHHRIVKRARSTGAWEKRLIATYGITADEYNAIYEHQGGRCYICRRGTGVRKRLSVDHDHKTGEIRGLLDVNCNRNILGGLRDDLDAVQRIADYLTDPPAKQIIGSRIAPIHDLTRNDEEDTAA